MTDMYEPHEREAGHDEVLTPEHAEVREAPSDYEFADEHSATAEHSEEQDTTVATANPKGRSPLLPITAAVVGVALLGGVAWWQFGGSQTSGFPPVNTASMAPIPAPAPAAEIAPPPPPLPVAQTVDATQAPTPVIAAPSAPVAPAPSSAMPVLNAPAAAPAAPVMPVAAAPVVQAPVVTASDARIDALSAHMDDLQKSLDQVTQQLGQVNTMVAANANNNVGANAPSTQDLQNRIDALEQQIAQLHHGSSTHNAPTLSAPAAMPDEGIVAMPDSNPVKMTPHHVKKVKPVATKAAAVKKPAAPAATWVLRAASPGQAWVSNGATSTDLKQVHVGDTLDGIGHISSINQANGNWVVVGSKGTIQ